MSDILYIYTMTFPFGRGEAFLEAEVDVLSRHFSKIVIIPMNPSGELRKLSPNISVERIMSDDMPKSSAWDRIRFMMSAKIKMSFIKDIRYQWSLAGDIVAKAKSLSKYLIAADNGVHYSYWLDEWSLILSIVSSNSGLLSYISRAHGFDLYEDRSRLGYRSWRVFQLDNISAVYCIANQGLEYLKKLYPQYENKLNTSFLGTVDRGLSSLSKDGAIRLVSCSSLIPLKRVERIISILSHIDRTVEWTHIGDGPEMDSLKVLADDLDDNIIYNFTGSMPHDDVLEYYRDNPVDCFINVSSTEGLPVTIMEAISFGVPIIATDVGGVSEIVTSSTGVLLDSDFDDSQAAEILLSLIENSSNQAFRFRVRKFWEENFSAEKNYLDFSNKIKN